MSSGLFGLPNIVQALRTSALTVLGKPGATAGTCLAGATASGAPTSGSFSKGDAVVDQTGGLWICTAAGSPGTWAQVGGGGGASLTYHTTVLAADVTLVNGNTFYDGPSMSCEAGTWLLIGVLALFDSAVQARCTAKLWDGTNVIACTESGLGPATGNMPIMGIVTPTTTTTYKISVANNAGASQTVLKATAFDLNTGTTATMMIGLKIA